ncbi:MAG TPA: nucleotide disphospho-sugar-binding domain-containing protein [Caulobacteraceae bacterium]|nr:nucleotide disphospho-sugar-binding domain-containing protein [Caulobacteraceae bacterium]
MLQRASAFFDAVPLVLVPSYAAFNPEQSFGPAVRHVGPIREPANPRPWPRRFPERPFVLASLSTSFQDQAATLQRICDALSLLEVEALVTTGPAMPPEAFHAADHVELRRYTPHDEVLALTDLAITHCGHGTVMACAGAGAPMLCMPMGRDQHFVASRVEALGLGKVVDHTATATEIAEAVSAMLSNSGWKHAAVGFAAGVQRFGALELAATLVQQVAVHQRVEASLAQPI